MIGNFLNEKGISVIFILSHLSLFPTWILIYSIHFSLYQEHNLTLLPSLSLSRRRTHFPHNHSISNSILSSNNSCNAKFLKIRTLRSHVSWNFSPFSPSQPTSIIISSPKIPSLCSWGRLLVACSIGRSEKVIVCCNLEKNSLFLVIRCGPSFLSSFQH